MGSLIQAIRQKHCRHKLIHCGKWLHEGKTWHLTCQCAVCDREIFHISLKDACAEKMYDEMQKEKGGEVKEP